MNHFSKSKIFLYYLIITRFLIKILRFNYNYNKIILKINILFSKLFFSYNLFFNLKILIFIPLF
jgi:hypothetical protein